MLTAFDGSSLCNNICIYISDVALGTKFKAGLIYIRGGGNLGSIVGESRDPRSCYYRFT